MDANPSLRILVASPTSAGAEKMARLLSSFTGFNVIGTVTELVAAIGVIEHAKPDFVLLSNRFRGEPDSEVFMAVLQARDIRWLELSSRTSPQVGEHTARPPTSGLFEIDAKTEPEVLAHQIRAVCRNMRSPVGLPKETVAQGHAHPLHDKIILIGASTGGVDCLIQVLSEFTPDCPPTLIVQHTGNDFLKSLVTLLDRRCPVSVIPAQEGHSVTAGQVVLAGNGAMHLKLASGRPAKCALAQAPPITGHRPSVDALFQSAVPFAKHVVAALLTGMGRDGAAGLLALRRAGAITLAQDEASSKVYGMPRVANELGAVDHILSISDIASVLSGRMRLPPPIQGTPT